jgi:hypothetical protein
MRWARRGTHAREKFTGFGWECQKERDHLEDQGVDEKMVSEWIIGKLPGGVEWIQLAQDRGRLRADACSVTTESVLKVHYRVYESLARVTSPSQSNPVQSSTKITNIVIGRSNIKILNSYFTNTITW